MTGPAARAQIGRTPALSAASQTATTPSVARTPSQPNVPIALQSSGANTRPEPSRLRTPDGHGATLVEPPAATLAATALSNQAALADERALIAGIPLAALRRRARAALGLTDAPLIVTGHQPDFIHPGVWAKHVAAMRMAEALGGTALNVVVDSDAPKSAALRIPVEHDRRDFRLERIRYADVPAGHTFDQIPVMPSAGVRDFASRIKAALGPRYDATLMPVFLAALHEAADSRRWVDQVVAARRAIEREMDVQVADVCVCRLPLAPFLADWILNAGQFSTAYNAALDAYRAAHRIRSPHRPIPDLAAADGRTELPLWLSHPAHGRQRAFVRPGPGGYTLFAGNMEVGRVTTAELRGAAESEAAEWSGPGDWRVRPRALALTLWMRLCLADFFIHGIGGAKYDLITDEIIRLYYNTEPPGFGCVSATLWMLPPPYGVTADDVAAAKLAARDTRWNPQRHLDGSPGGAAAALVAARQEAVVQSETLRRNRPGDRAARRDAFLRVREASGALLATMPDVVDDADRRVEDVESKARRDRIATGREYFFGLYSRDALRVLVRALHASEGFRV